ncbi:2-polyprenyl-6-methoxyphenol hydroxylase [Sinosporangium album]|uniref:2-polyprenyl-6-methoxyphenol hydroxylase n=1 Tax=Sinosporangium album TaxID=504805 RepID=A0A1G8G9P8_9ACTN|nr:2-polyprenyl-6-methoxyphenol hydroxylase [Sinosporangium album]
MKIACVGGGPAGLYFAILMKRVNPSHEITVYERNSAGASCGWGVTYWEELFDNLRRADPESAQAVKESSLHWDHWAVHVHDQAAVTVNHWDEGYGIGRRQLLGILADRARALGVRTEFEREIASEDELAGTDLIAAADGAGSVLRGRHADHFGTEIAVGRNVYTWLGTTKIFDCFTFSFVETPHGWIWCYGYGFSEGHSTCVVECSPATWRGLELDQASEAEGLVILEKLFADILDGHPLIGRTCEHGGAHWLNFQTLTNRTWHRGNLVLLGDAAHTTHYSVGAGTALALGDAAFLVNALHEDPRLESALSRYERKRQSAIMSVQRAARYSAQWYENLPRYAGLPPRQMVALLGRRYSQVLPHVPPRLYYRINQVAEWFEARRGSTGGPEAGGPERPGRPDEIGAH